MRQLTFVKAGKLEWRDVPPPTLQGTGEAIVRPISVARCDLDAALLFGRAPVPGPFALGHEFIAEVVEIGEAVTSVSVGDRVVVTFQISCGHCRRCGRNVTGSCSSVPTGAMYGLGASRGDWGGALSDLVRVPFADAMLLPLPADVDPVAAASASDNIADGYRTVGPFLEADPDTDVLIVGGGAWSVGLYAAAIAVALGARRVDYLDTDRKRLEIAEKVGATPVESTYPERFGQYGITVDASADPAGLACALRSVEPEGICTSVGIYFTPTTPIPLNEMFYNGITFKTGRAHSRPNIPKVLDVIRAGKFKPELVTTRVAAWDDAAEALLEPTAKVIIAR